MQHFYLILVIFVVLFGVLVTSTVHDCQFPGIVGCRFNNDICLEDEDCVDDLLFGNCQKSASNKDRYSYVLTVAQLQQLEDEVRRLVKEEYEWQDLYTQCVISSLLLSFRCHRPYDRSICDGGSITLRDENLLKEEAARLLQTYLKDYYDELITPPEIRSTDDDIVDIEDGQNELVRVHKYKKARKRVMLDDNDYANLETLLQLSPDELQQLSDYLDEEESRVSSNREERLESSKVEKMENSRERISDETSVEERGTLKFPALSSDESLEKMFQSKDSDTEDGSWNLPADDTSIEEIQTDNMQTTPEDVLVLKQLLNGEKDVSSVDRAQSKRLEQLVMEMIAELKTGDDSTEFSNEAAQEKADEKGFLQDTAEGMNKPGMFAAEEEQKDQIMDKETLVKKAQMSANDDGLGVRMSPVSPTSSGRYELLNVRYAYISLEPKPATIRDAEKVMSEISRQLNFDFSAVRELSVSGNDVSFSISPNVQGLNSSYVASLAPSLSDDIFNKTGYHVQGAGIGRDVADEVKVTIVEPNKKRQYFLITFVLCGIIVIAVLIVLVIYVARRNALSKKKLAQLAESGDPNEATKDLQDLCRQRMLSKSSEKPEPLNAAIAAIQRTSASTSSDPALKSPSSRGSTSSWSEEPVTSSMDITTGHIVLSYMEDHLHDKERLDREWEALSSYEAEPNDTSEAIAPANLSKNRYSDILPYDHSRVILNRTANSSSSDYINASFITDHDPRNPAYIVTQGPLQHTIADFWQMVWEQGCMVIVNLTELSENGRTMCHRYWPHEGSEIYHSYEVHLVSEHIWCEDYLVRSFYLKNLQTNETRTVTQFHYLTWRDMGVPNMVKILLDFRRKVNKSYRGRSCPIIVHCSDGAGRTGTYCLIDLVLNRMNKGAKEIDMAASLEHIRDQRMNLVKSKEQFEFALAAVAEEVHAILKALAQQ